MNKNSYTRSDEIDLRQLFKTIWKEKIKIILIMLVTIVINFGHNQYKISNRIDLFEISTNIRPSKLNLSEKFLYINETLDSRSYSKKENKKIITRQNVLERFIDDIMYHEELITILKNNYTVKEKISQLSEKDKAIKLYQYTKLLTVEEIENKKVIYNLRFQWHNADEGIQIIEEILKLTNLTLQKKIFNENKEILENERKTHIANYKQNLKYLTQQYKIAKALGIEGGKEMLLINDDKPSNESTISIEFDNKDGYYLRGYKVIEMEIDFLKEKDNLKLVSMMNEMNNFKISDKENWVYYNLASAEIKLLNADNGMKYSFSVIIGIIIGLFYTFIVYWSQSQKVIRNKKSN